MQIQCIVHVIPPHLDSKYCSPGRNSEVRGKLSRPVTFGYSLNISSVRAEHCNAYSTAEDLHRSSFNSITVEGLWQQTKHRQAIKAQESLVVIYQSLPGIE